MRGDEGPVRRPAHAGAFYPANPAELGRLVEACLASAASRAGAAMGPARPGVLPAPIPTRGMLVPHAGLVYSGAVAAAAWQLLFTERPGTIVLVGTNHYVGELRGVAVWPAGRWQSPTGAVQVDETLAQQIVALGPPFAADPAAHLAEHSLEVQLPFLLRVAPDVPVVPLLVSFHSRRSGEDAGRRLGTLLAGVTPSPLVVISSDLVHYPPAAEAERADRDLLEPIVALDGEELARREDDLLRAGIPGLVCGLCGMEPTLFGLAALRAMGAGTGEILAAATSADVPFGDRRRTVGYAAVAFR